MKKIVIREDVLVIEKDKEFLVMSGVIPSNYGRDSLSNLTEDDLELVAMDHGYNDPDVVFTINDDGSLSIRDFNDLKQFNCCHSLRRVILAMIKTYEQETASDQRELESAMENPMSFRSQLFKDVVIGHKVLVDKYIQDHFFQFKFKGHDCTATNAMSKYCFVDVAPHVIQTLSELVDYYITMNKILAKACFDDGDTSYLSNSDWAEQNAETISKQFSAII